MDKKGFTLVEVIAAIALMAILAILVTPSIIRIRQDVLSRTYESRLELINSAALNWGGDNLDQVPVNITSDYSGSRDCTSECICLTVQELIDSDYLPGSDDDGRTMKNPITGENLGNNSMCVRYDKVDNLTRKLITYRVNWE